MTSNTDLCSEKCVRSGRVEIGFFAAFVVANTVVRSRES